MSLIRCAVALVAFAVMALAQSAAIAPAFEVASVKPDLVGTNEGPGRGNEILEPTPLGLTMRNIRLRSALKWAYRLQTDQIQGPGWMDSERYAIVAKAGRPATEGQLRLMLQSLLVERFKIELHRDTKEMTVSVLTLDKNGPKFKASAEPGDGGVHYEIKNKVVAERATLSQFADSLTNALRSVVVNETGLDGHYDLTLDLGVYDPIPPEDFPSATARGLREQLGIKVEAGKRDMPILIIDHAEKAPAEN